MTKAQKLREALAANGNTLPLADAVKIAGSRANISNMIKTGEVEITDGDDGKVLTLDPSHKTKRALPIKRPRKTKRAQKAPKHKRARRAARNAATWKTLADKLATDAPPLRELLLGNLLASTEHLAATLRREVEGLDTNPTLVAAIEQTERAAALARAA